MKQQSKQTVMNKLENEYITYSHQGGILYSEFKKELALSLEKCKEAIDLRHRISNGKNQYWCMNLKSIRMYDADAREYAEKFGQDLLFACAVVTPTQLSKFFFNVFAALHKPRIPFKSFTTQENAVKWLLEIKAQHQN